jgi:hypothetical protein
LVPAILFNKELCLIMAESKPKQKQYELKDGRKVTIQKPGVMWYLEFADKCKNNAGVIQQSKYVPGVLKNCVVPPMTVDDFDEDISVLEDLIAEVESFLRNRERQALSE